MSVAPHTPEDTEAATWLEDELRKTQWQREAAAAAVEIFKRHLAKSHSQLWSRAFDVSTESGQEEAARWFVGQMILAKLL